MSWQAKSEAADERLEAAQRPRLDAAAHAWPVHFALCDGARLTAAPNPCNALSDAMHIAPPAGAPVEDP